LKDNNTLLLEYALGNEHSYLWAITSESFTWHELPNRTTIEKAAGDIYKLLTAREPINGETQSQAEQRALAADAQYGDRSLELSRMLLGPVRDQLGVRRIIIVADGALQYVPFEALPVDFSNGTDSPSLATAPGDRPPLVREHEVLYLQSASMLRVLSRARSVSQSQQNRVLVFADPVFAENDPRVRPSPQDQVKENNAHAATEPQALVGELPGNLPRLPSTLQEAKMILSAAPYGSTKILTGFEANKQATVASDFSQYKILHFATHAIINSEHPELSGIVLSLVDRNGKRQSGFLRLPDVYKLNLDADLIVVSACRSALGQHFSGEGFIGLTRGFMSGGARSVVASLWKVDDEATAELMNQFYRAMFNEGLPPSAALRKAKQAMQVSPQWSHPYFWAAFVLQGEYRERISVDHNGTAQGSAITELLMILALLGLCVRSRQRKRTG
jgi:CHAT domain-containing protein